MKIDFELKLASNKIVVWDGEDGEDASRNYMLSHPGEIVMAWRYYPRHGIFIGDVRKIVEPDERKGQ